MGQEPDLMTLWLQLPREMSQEMWGTLWLFDLLIGRAEGLLLLICKGQAELSVTSEVFIRPSLSQRRVAKLLTVFWMCYPSPTDGNTRILGGLSKLTFKGYLVCLLERKFDVTQQGSLQLQVMLQSLKFDLASTPPSSAPAKGEVVSAQGKQTMPVKGWYFPGDTVAFSPKQGSFCIKKEPCPDYKPASFDSVKGTSNREMSFCLRQKLGVCTRVNEWRRAVFGFLVSLTKVKKTVKFGETTSILEAAYLSHKRLYGSLALRLFKMSEQTREMDECIMDQGGGISALVSLRETTQALWDCDETAGREDSKESCPERQPAKQLAAVYVGRSTELRRVCDSVNTFNLSGPS
ncbi:hypothetical protein Anapl_00778 [Anas platyrhynchos]|uniref:Uncharacterized protein n=1 Tax=Anas platyrhynchos TaxID=8839 RepID=R0JTG7_ANAPL|nr:hypothetical protein Anapl_00778 [Anas platyrhynchos]